ncbi:MAG TPA: S8 family serine peptidase, partial [Saprospiraceae bacterium]|nr:S8 family serine peptidase [Saprospiraceae bacterium]
HDGKYWVRITRPQNATVAQALFTVDPHYKLSFDPNQRAGVSRFKLAIAKSMTDVEINQWATDHQVSLLDIRALKYGMIDVALPTPSIEILLETPWISFVQEMPVIEAINYRALPGERGWALISPFDRGLNGTGMTIGIGDGGRVEVHEDLVRDYLDLASFGTADHPTQVSGIISGAGLIDPFYGFGYAPEAHIILRNFDDILWASPQYIQDFNMSLTNNSYGSNLNNCTYMGDYDAISVALDAMVSDHPQLLHVFAAANSGGMTCGPFPTSYATVAGGFQPAKNVLVAGAITIADANASFSSRGPVDDGRIKPEIVANGSGRFTTVGTNNYTSGSGTSFSSPATMGTATLIYQRYKQLHSDSLPDAALIKNVLCNAADDLGNTGPDYTFGFGRINGDRAARILEDHHYLTITADQGNVITRTITIPSGTAAVDVMITWTDEASAPYETVDLVNDLDLTVVSPNGDTLKPWILNCTPSGVASTATTGFDHFNNIEQVTISNPVAGNYTLIVKGYLVPMGPQKAWISWDIQENGIKVQSPNGGEIFRPVDQQYIRWDAFGTGTSTFSVDYSTNGGSSWTNLSSGLPSSQRYLAWAPPSLTTDQLKVRVTASNAMQDVSNQNAVIMIPPANFTATSPCNGNIQVSWSAVTGAIYYRIYMIRNERLSVVDTSFAITKVLHDYPVDSSVWLTVAGVFASGTAGLRARAVSVTANGGSSCTWPNDLRLDSLVSLHSGRRLTSSALSATQNITVHLANLGTTNASGFSLSFQVNNSLAVTNNFPGTLNAGTSQNFTFSKTADLSAPGTYRIKVWTTFASDPFHENDTLIVTVRQLDNPTITLPWSNGFESLADTSVISNLIGINGLNAADIQLQSGARVRTYAGSPFCFAGQRAMTMDAIRTGSSKNNEVILTLNLSNYHVANDDVRLSFHVMHHEIILDDPNTEAIWIRGADNLPFVLLAMIPNEASTRGHWQYLAGLEISQTLSNAGQEFSSSFQMKFES